MSFFHTKFTRCSPPIFSALLLFSLSGCGVEDATLSGSLFEGQSVSLTTSVMPEEGGTIYPANATVLINSSIRIQAIPSDEWVFDKWVINGVEHDSSNIELLMDSDKNAIAYFSKRLYDLTLLVEGGGTVETKLLASKDSSFESGSILELLAVPDTGWVFSGWVGDMEGVQNPQQITLDSDKLVKAIFNPLNCDSDGAYSSWIEGFEEYDGNLETFWEFQNAGEERYGPNLYKLTDEFSIDGQNLQLEWKSATYTQRKFGYGTYVFRLRTNNIGWGSGYATNTSVSLFIDDETGERLDIGIRPDDTDDYGYNIIGYGLNISYARSEKTGSKRDEWYTSTLNITPETLTFLIDDALIESITLSEMPALQDIRCGQMELRMTYGNGSFDLIEYSPYYP